MLVGKIILKYLPFGYYRKIRNWYRDLIKSIHKPLSESDFRSILSGKLGIGYGDVVFVHSSVDKLNLGFNPYRVLSILQEITGTEGTLLFPSWHFTERAEDYLRSGRIFNVKKSPSALGLISELARRFPEAKRSLHPTNSITAIGKHADFLLNDHGSSIYPCDETSPFYKMMAFNAKIIGIGVSAEFLSFVHCPEDVLKGEFPVKTRSTEGCSATVIDFSGISHEIVTLYADKAITKRDINKFLKLYAQAGVAKNFRIRGNSFFNANAKGLYDLIIQKAKEGITIYS
jgi:aminoglycoside 3-N-acetyltransferase